MLRFAYLTILLMLPFNAACKPVLEIEGRGYTANATRCIEREARLVAPKRINLEKAASDVVQRCDVELHTKEQALIASYPDLANMIQEQWKTVTAMRLRQARRAVIQARMG